jgi:nicotinamidase-related amidase
MYTLVVVDMQPHFEAAQCDQTTAEVIKAIKKAKQDQAGIVVLEYTRCGPTRDDILTAIGEYEKFATKIKDRDGGGRWVLEAVRELELNDTLFRVCGVNTACCVHDTAMDLLDFEKRVELIKNACNQPAHFFSRPEDAMARLERNGAVIAA